MKKNLIIKIIIGIFAVGTVATTSVIVVPKVMNNIEQRKIEQEKQQDLDNISLSLKQQELILPYQGAYNQNLYDNQFDLDILEGVADNTKYERFVEDYKGGNLTITNNININEIGEYEVIYTVTSEKENQKTEKLIVKVQDMMKPQINIANETIEIYKGTEVNVMEGVTAEDNVDSAEELTAKITTEGTVDTNTIGEYTITYKVTDNSGLSAEGTRIYKVVEKKEVKIGSTYSHRIYNENYTNGYADSTVIFKTGNKIDYKEVSDMAIFNYKGTYTISNGVVTAKVEVNDFVDGYSSKTVKFKIQDQNTIVCTNNGYTYKVQ